MVGPVTLPPDVSTGPRDHIVQFYDGDADLVRHATDFLVDSLACGSAAVAVATRTHLAAFRQSLQANGVDVARAQLSGHLVLLDAADVLAELKRHDRLDDQAFERVVGGIVRAAGPDRRRVHVYGEVVALLWEQGDVAGAMEVESRWNALGRSLSFSLMCGYPVESVRGTEYTAARADLCLAHTGVFGLDVSDSVAAGNEAATTERRTTLPPLPSSVRVARMFLADVLEHWGESDLLDDASLVVTELATNAIIHTATDFEVSVASVTDGVRITVRDGSNRPPRLRRSGWLAESGRGLGMIAAISRRHGHHASTDGKAVWVELQTRRRYAVRAESRE